MYLTFQAPGYGFATLNLPGKLSKTATQKTYLDENYTLFIIKFKIKIFWLKQYNDADLGDVHQGKPVPGKASL